MIERADREAGDLLTPTLIVSSCRRFPNRFPEIIDSVLLRIKSVPLFGPPKIEAHAAAPVDSVTNNRSLIS